MEEYFHTGPFSVGGLWQPWAWGQAKYGGIWEEVGEWDGCVDFCSGGSSLGIVKATLTEAMVLVGGRNWRWE